MHPWIEVDGRRWCLPCGSYQVRRAGKWADALVGPWPGYNRTRGGCGMAGLGDDEIGQWFGPAPKKVYVPGQPSARAAATPRGPVALPPVPASTWVLPEGDDAYPSLEGEGCIAIDLETRDPELLAKGPGEFRPGCVIAGVAVGTQAGFRQYYPIGHEVGPNLDASHVLAWLATQLALPVPKIGANILYDLGYLARAGVPVVGPFYDVQVAEPLLDENRLTYSLESLAQKYLGTGKVASEMERWLVAAYGKDKWKSNIWRAPPAVVGPYAIGDVDLPLRIFDKQTQALEDQGLWGLFILESKLIPMLLAMRQRGVPVNVAGAEELYDKLKGLQEGAVAAVLAATGVRPELWAAESLAKVFDAVGVKYPRTERGAPSFRKEWLGQQAHPVAGMIREARELDKLRESFVKGVVIDSNIAGRIHCQFNQLRSDDSGTVSGRFSSSHPNLQQIPIRSKYGGAIRALFVAEHGEQWWKFDWSQVEYRILVHYAAKRGLPGAQDAVDRYNNDPETDFHKVVAELTGLPRSNAKNLNFGMAYGQGVDLLCHNLGVDRAEGERIIGQYHTRAPYIRKLAQQCTQWVNKHGEIKTLGGRVRRFDLWETGGVVSRTEMRDSKRANTHKALNALIQGSAADIMKTAMVQLWESGVCDVLGAPHLTVHDELDGSLPPSAGATEALGEVRRVMEGCVKLLVPLRADGGTGVTWTTTEEA